jgi:hypothetical protein
VQKISTEKCNEGPTVAVVTRGRARTGVDMTNEGKKTKQWVRKSVGPMPNFEPQQENETYYRARKEVLRVDWGVSMPVAPQVEDRVVPEKPTGKVSTLT